MKRCVMLRPVILVAVVLIGMPGFAERFQEASVSLTIPAKTMAPDFALPDAHSGKGRSLSEFIKARRPIALFFFCGCSACHDVAKEWGKIQRAGVLPEAAATVIVYSTTEASEARHRAASAGLVVKRSAVLCDTNDLRVTQGLYHSEPCPRLLVIDPAGKIAYINTGDDEKPQEAPATRLVTRALSALNAVVAATGGR